MNDERLPQADTLRSQRSITFFLAQLPPVYAEIEHLRHFYDVACNEFRNYLDKTTRDKPMRYETIAKPKSDRTMRDPQELKIKMRHVKERSGPLRKAQDLAVAINEKIDHHIKRLTLGPCQALCEQVMEKLPPELREEIYHHITRELDSCETPYGQIFAQHLKWVIDVPQLSYWMRMNRSIPPFEIMEVWLGRDFALEFIADWYRRNQFRPFDLSSSFSTCSWLDRDIWGSPLDPRKLITTASFILEAESIDFKKGAYRTALASTIDRLKSFESDIAQLKSSARVDILIRLKDMRRVKHKSEADRLLNEDEQETFIRIFVGELQKAWEASIRCRVIKLRFVRGSDTVEIASDGEGRSLSSSCVEKLGRGRPEDEEDEAGPKDENAVKAEDDGEDEGEEDEEDNDDDEEGEESDQDEGGEDNNADDEAEDENSANDEEEGEDYTDNEEVDTSYGENGYEEWPGIEETPREEDVEDGEWPAGRNTENACGSRDL